MEMNSESKSEINVGQIVWQVHRARQGWDQPGITAAVRKAMAGHSLELIRDVALVAALDQSAGTPGVIPARCNIEAERRKRTGDGQAREASEGPRPVRTARHCGRDSCRCDHVNCYGGWVDDLFDADRPCPECRPNIVVAGSEQHRREATRPAPAPISQATRALIEQAKHRTQPKGETNA
jgi:hypothetical protein